MPLPSQGSSNVLRDSFQANSNLQSFFLRFLNTGDCQILHGAGAERAYAVDGTPADTVQLALAGNLFEVCVGTSSCICSWSFSGLNENTMMQMGVFAGSN